MALTAGTRVGPYEIVAPVGAGGMGVVYRAEDTRLRRPVALKFLPSTLTDHADAKRRFIQEAQTASALDHPNICTIYEVNETSSGELFLVMAFYQGETLQQKIERGPLSIDAALGYAIQAAQGLAKAHDAGIIHRDIKPANILITTDDVLKILDFGVAKLVDQTALTQTGTTVGTVAYMSPEQTMGAPLDARTDLWSLGVVLYQMIAGERPFTGDHPLAIANAIVNASPPLLNSRRTEVPPAVDRIVTRLLAKQPNDRYPTAADLLVELRRAQQTRLSAAEDQLVESRGSATAGRRGSRIALVAGGVGILAVAGYLMSSNRDQPSAQPRLENPVQIAASVAVEGNPAWSPDGRMIAYDSNHGGRTDVWLVQATGGTPVNRTGDRTGIAARPQWSPDGRQIMFYVERSESGNGTFVMPALAGASRQVCDFVPNFGDTGVWSPDGAELGCIKSMPGGIELELQHVQSGARRRLKLPGESPNVRVDMRWSPDGRFLAYVDTRNVTAQVTRIWNLRLSDAHALPLTEGRTNAWSPSWAPDSSTLYYVSNRGGPMDLWRQRLDDTGAPQGEPDRLTTGMELASAAVSPNGTRIAYSKGRAVGNLWRVPILADRPATWADAQQLTFDQAHIEFAAVSPDGQRVIVSSDRSGNPDLWLLPAAGGDMQPLTTDPTPDWSMDWSPNGREVTFYSYRSGNRDIWVQPLAGGPARQLTRGEPSNTYPRWSPDGQRIAFESTSGGIPTIAIVLVAGGPAQLIPSDRRHDHFPTWSPDGKWIAFVAPRPQGGHAIWRMRPDGSVAERLTNGVDDWPLWSPNGGEIYFVGTREGVANVWQMAVDNRTERKITDLKGRAGFLSPTSLANDTRYIYFSWREDIGDLWVADLVSPR